MLLRPKIIDAIKGYTYQKFFHDLLAGVAVEPVMPSLYITLLKETA